MSSVILTAGESGRGGAKPTAADTPGVSNPALLDLSGSAERACIQTGAKRFNALLQGTGWASLDTSARFAAVKRSSEATSHEPPRGVSPVPAVSLYPMVVAAHRIAFAELVVGAVPPVSRDLHEAALLHSEALAWLARLSGSAPVSDAVNAGSAWNLWREVEAQRSRFAALHYLEHRLVVCKRFERDAIAALIDELQHSLQRCFQRLATPVPAERLAAVDASARVEAGRRPVEESSARSVVRGLAVLLWTGRAALEAWAQWSARTANTGWVHGSDWSRFLRFALGRDWADGAARAFAVLESVSADCSFIEKSHAGTGSELAGSVALSAMFHARESQRDVERLIEEIRSRMAMSPLPLVADEAVSLLPSDHRVAMASTWRDLQVRRLDWRNRVQACLEPDGLAAMLDELAQGLARLPSGLESDTIGDALAVARLAEYLVERWSQREAGNRPAFDMIPTTSVSQR
ncbi:MAG: hypothetical protein ACK4IT_02860 [Thioalkalivibrionaceae bacterium]